MTEEEQSWHRKVAVGAFNQTWDWMEKAERTPHENDTMLNTAHASRYHWELVGNAENLAVGEWQIARVYTLLGRSEPALYHAKRAVEICVENGITNFALAYGWEAVARAESMAGHKGQALESIVKAKEVGESLDEETRQRLWDDLNTIGASE